MSGRTRFSSCRREGPASPDVAADGRVTANGTDSYPVCARAEPVERHDGGVPAQCGQVGSLRTHAIFLGEHACGPGVVYRAAADSVALDRRCWEYQLSMYRMVRMKLDGFVDVPWYSPSKRSSFVGTPRSLSAA